ncbi:WD40 repeat domain-containing protein [Zavarzinella formosa]|uniref:WD40 repeat domain-containing protein n=1 Tax=Zavarzinella formosa TaxID=360055 RepID=UPI0002FAD50C|nr:WD40 repeat domain-containing protein [Zavarzinella formosa]
MKPLSLLVVLTLSLTAFGQQASRERGRFSIQGGAPSVLTVDNSCKYVLAAFDSGMVVVFPMDQKTVALHCFSSNKKAVTGAAFAPDGKTFIMSSADGTVKYWDVLAARKHHMEMEKSSDSKPTNPTPVKTINAHLGGSVTSMSLSPDGKTLLTTGSDNTLKVWEVEEGKLVNTVKDVHGVGGIKAVLFAPDGKHFATAGGDKSAKLWELQEAGPKMLFKLDGHEGAVNAISFSPDGKHLATGSGVVKKSGSIRIWDTETGKVEYKLEGPEDNVTAVLFSLKGDLLASGGYDLKIRVWNLADKTQKYADDHAEPLRGLMNSPDGKYMGTISKTAIRWWAGLGK